MLSKSEILDINNETILPLFSNHRFFTRIKNSFCIANTPSFKWPSTIATDGNTPINEHEWPQVGLLKFKGYTVGTKGGNSELRRKILSEIFSLSAIPHLNSQSYIDEWGKSNSSARLRKMAESIAAFCRNAKRKNAADMDDAIQEWEDDLRWLKQQYYLGRFDKSFAWPHTN